MTDPGTRFPARRLAGLALAAGGALRFATLDLQSFDHDEAVTAGRVLAGSLGDALSILPDSERTPPLYYVVAWAWSQVFGTGEIGLRSLSALVGTLTIPLAFLAARSLAGPRAGVVAAWLFALNPLLVWYSQQARAYALLALLATASMWLLARALADPAPGRLAAWALCCALALATHYFALFVVLPQAVWLLYAAGPRRAPLAAIGGIAAAGLALLPLALEQSSDNAGPAGLGSLPYRAAVAGVQFAAGENPGPRSGSALEIAFVCAGALAWLAAAYGVCVGFRRGADRERRGAQLAGTVGLAGVGVPVLLGGIGVDLFTGPNAIAALCALLLAAGMAMAARGRGRGRPLAILVVLACFAAAAIATATNGELQRHDWRALAEALGRPGPAAAIAAPPSADDPLELYLRLSDLEPAGRELSRIELVQFAPVDDQPSEPPAPGFALGELRQVEGFTVRTYERPRPLLLTPEQLDSWEPFERDELLERSRYVLVRRTG